MSTFIRLGDDALNISGFLPTPDFTEQASKIAVQNQQQQLQQVTMQPHPSKSQQPQYTLV